MQIVCQYLLLQLLLLPELLLHYYYYYYYYYYYHWARFTIREPLRQLKQLPAETVHSTNT